MERITLAELLSEPPPHPEREDHFRLSNITMVFPCTICVHGDSPLIHKEDCETCRHYWR